MWMSVQDNLSRGRSSRWHSLSGLLLEGCLPLCGNIDRIRSDLNLSENPYPDTTPGGFENPPTLAPLFETRPLHRA